MDSLSLTHSTALPAQSACTCRLWVVQAAMVIPHSRSCSTSSSAHNTSMLQPSYLQLQTSTIFGESPNKLKKGKKKKKRRLYIIIFFFFQMGKVFLSFSHHPNPANMKNIDPNQRSDITSGERASMENFNPKVNVLGSSECVKRGVRWVLLHQLLPPSGGFQTVPACPSPGTRGQKLK